MVETAVLSSPPEGLIIELVTPLTAAGRLDTGGLSRLISRVSPYAAAIVAGGPGLGEALRLPLALRRELLSCLLQEWHGCLFFGITADSGEETVSLAQHLEAECLPRPYDSPVYWLDLPLWYHSNRGLPQVYQNFLASTQRPLVLLNQPEIIRHQGRPWKHLNLRTAVFKKLTALAGIRGLIYHGEMSRLLNYHRAAVSRPDFALYEGDESRFLTRPGSWGVVSAGAQLLPAAWQAITQTCLHPEESAPQSGSRQELWELSTRLVQLYQMYQDQPVALLKAALQALGVLDTDTTSPATAPAPPESKRRLLDSLSQLVGQLPAHGDN